MKLTSCKKPNVSIFPIYISFKTRKTVAPVLTKQTKNAPKTHLTLTFDLDIQYTFRGCQGTRSCKIPSSSVQQFMSYRADRENWQRCRKQYCCHFRGQ